MTCHRPSVFAAALALVASGLLAASSPGRADDTGISASVDPVLDLSIDSTASGALAATVTSTVSRTRLSVGAGPGARVLGDFDGPVTGKRQVVRVGHPTSTSDLTITFGPQGP